MGLDFIRKLEPVNYVLKSNHRPETGFIAQDVEKIDPQFPGINKPSNEKGFYSLTSTDFIPAIVRAIQELGQKEKIAVASEIDKRLNNLETLSATLALLLILTISFCIYMCFKLRKMNSKFNNTTSYSCHQTS
jgi:hypothetical protein